MSHCPLHAVMRQLSMFSLVPRSFHMHEKSRKLTKANDWPVGSTSCPIVPGLKPGQNRGSQKQSDSQITAVLLELPC